MTTLPTAPYGSWKSPITSDLIIADSIRLGEPTLADAIYWLELRPKEGGRQVLVQRAADGQTTDVTPAPYNVRTRVHEYGGGAYGVTPDTVYFSNFADQRLYRQAHGEPPRPVTPETALRYADYVVDTGRNLLFAVREDHRGAGEAVNTLVKVQCDGDQAGGQVLVSGHDFYSTPRLSPDGSQLAWLAWDHPNMPWDGCELWIGQVNADGSLGQTARVAGGRTESIFQPEWSPDGMLYFVSDRTGWWNLYRWQAGEVEALCPMEAEFGQPQWSFGQSTYAFASPERLICTYSRQGESHLARLNTRTLKLEVIETPYTDIRNLCAASGRALFIGGSPTEGTSVVLLDLATGQHEVLRRSSALQVDPGYISIPQAIEFPTENGLTAHALFYAPRNCDYVAPESERPPLLVLSHGGPTGATSALFNMKIQYWTSRGIAVLDVNYGGSTGYGRAYRQRLNGQWGIVDVDDCVNAARYLVDRGQVDGNRLAIAGGSAGGYTTLSALTFRNVFRAGASHFGVADLELLAKDTHKFESRYLDNLIGPYPERRDLYIERSPIHHVELLSCPLILFQGLEDKVVPPEQAEKMFVAVRAKELPVSYLPFEGEQHGFRIAQNIKRVLDAELYFYAKIFGFELAESVEPVVIENL
ncbi:MAG: S9 family peptidase [Caldilineaceae bacterium]|nr:S9 family peptidase [Caldilineaceae bacterium]